MLVVAFLPAEQFTRPAIAGIVDADHLRHAVVVHVRAQVALIERHKVFGRIRVGLHAERVAVAGQLLVGKGLRRMLRQAFDLVAVKAHFDQFRPRLCRSMRREARGLDADGVLVDEKILGRNDLDADAPAHVDALEAQIERLHRNVDNLARLQFLLGDVGLVILGGSDDLDSFFADQQSGLLISQAGMLADLDIFGRVEPNLADAVAMQQAIVRRRVQNAVSVVVLPEDVVAVVRCLLRRLLVGRLLRLKLNHAVGRAENTNDAGQHPANRVSDIARRDRRTPRHRRQVRHFAVVVFDGLNALVGQFRSVEQHRRPNLAGHKRLQFIFGHFSH